MVEPLDRFTAAKLTPVKTNPEGAPIEREDVPAEGTDLSGSEAVEQPEEPPADLASTPLPGSRGEPIVGDLTDDDRARAWAMYEAGTKPAAIANALRRPHQKVQNYVYAVKYGKIAKPTKLEGASTALVVAPVRTLTIDGERATAVDPIIADRRAHDMAERQVEGFVRRELYQRS